MYNEQIPHIIDVLDTIESGNYTNAIEQMNGEPYIHSKDLIDYIETQESHVYSWYDLSTHEAVCNLHYKARAEQGLI